MKVDQLLAAFRSDLDDAVENYLWSDADLVRYLNSAVQEACERAKLIEDRLTPAVVPAQAFYELHASVFEIKRVTFRGRPLDETSVEKLDCDSPGWENRHGQPQLYIFEPATGKLKPRVRLVPNPTVVGDLVVTVYRGALKPLTEDQTIVEPEVPARFHEDLRHWVYRCACLKPDAETFNKVKALEHEAMFARAFGERPDANVQRKHRDKRPPVVRMRW
ncbi:phage adaptor protein [Diaphorobacter caeni]|uniref:phage adaptor protein n=1 Tax=Diaphorobacter caeni TaxID=2784387 RepID=UPI0018902015|nr:DUF6682 family protein [Diaphorobacter caeni]MBF5006854.1 hypothetical protein [Diaphorobacter caeni]